MAPVFTGTALYIAIAVCLAESAGNPNAVNTYHNTPPSRDRGLWQINSYWHPEVSDAAAFNPQSNAAAAYRISSHGTNWKPWSTYNSGSYRQFMARAQAAVTHTTPPGPTPHPVTYTLHRVLTQGMTGDDVRHVQAVVSCAQDGIYGPDTANHVRTWQRGHGLTQDGIVGPNTAHSFGWAWAG